ncbi:ADP-ribose pyrophosphatase YjhB, NUDIX family [Ekhidna lutea]|uniref:ADP-ribose pyrophosphatase YjhB, NUDIX family n=2 Tax=Ekhidna lutea TaxID=447679 RepID=A0A239L320_EKHLU|nr:ADP-ribose pyrophosphatase YjhB, NUDIX family [Ekhidna lutea]
MKRAYGLVVREFEDIVPEVLVDDVLIMNASFDQIDGLLKLMTDKKVKKVHSIFISSRKKRDLIDYIKSKFKVIEAGGGIVEKEGKLLMIYRRKVWDIPKGKLDNGESIEECAIREVEEETGVKAKIDHKIDAVWHTYVTKKKYVLKKTHWFAMQCVDDSQMAPQKDEGIKKVEWMDLDQVRKALHDSYRSIRYVMQEYTKMIPEA